MIDWNLIKGYQNTIIRSRRIRAHVKDDWFSFKIITIHGNKLDLKWTRYSEKLVTLAIKKSVLKLDRNLIGSDYVQMKCTRCHLKNLETNFDMARSEHKNSTRTKWTHRSTKMGFWAKTCILYHIFVHKAFQIWNERLQN